MTEYKTLQEYPGYRFSQYGKIETQWSINKNELVHYWRQLNGYIGNKGYIKVTIKHIDRGQITCNLNTLILEAFKGPKPYPWLQCRHLDDNKTNNNISNLEWGTSQDNSDDSKRNNTTLYGEKHGRAIITEEQAIKIKKLLIAGMEPTQISRDLKIAIHIIKRIKNNENWAHIKID